MSTELLFFDFKRKHSLGHSDICKITGCSLQQSQEWTKGLPIPEDIGRLIAGIDVVIDRIKLENGIFTDSDAQHAAHIIEMQNKEIAKLKAELDSLRSIPAISHKPINVDSVTRTINTLKIGRS